MMLMMHYIEAWMAEFFTKSLEKAVTKSVGHMVVNLTGGKKTLFFTGTKSKFPSISQNFPAFLYVYLSFRAKNSLQCQISLEPCRFQSSRFFPAMVNLFSDIVIENYNFYEYFCENLILLSIATQLEFSFIIFFETHSQSRMEANPFDSVLKRNGQSFEH